jgi:predicted Ser/Thr protein kinase
MESSSHDPLASLSDAELDELDIACEPFVQAMNAGQRPRIEDALSEASAELRAPLAAELVREEISYRRRQGETVAVDEYLERFPVLAPFADVLIASSAGNSAASNKTLLGRITDSTAPSAAQLAAMVIDPLPPQLGRFRIERELGRGGMGVVYLAYDEKLDRRLAIKAPVFDPASKAEAIPRFLREARAMANVRHANLCPVYEAGEIDGRHYLAMAYIEGQTLHQKMRQTGPTPPAEAATLVRKLAEAIQVAHEAGIVHRDLKPGNVLLDIRGEPVITDFGLARRASVGEIELTHTGALVGSPAYMAPEQVEGHVGEIGPATDIHALGVILYELLTGRRPYEGSMASVIGQIVHKEPIAPREINSEVSPALEAICLKAMAKRIEDRFANAKEMADALTSLSVLPGLTASSKFANGQRAKTRPRWVALAAILLLGAGSVGYWRTRTATLAAPDARGRVEDETAISPWRFVDSQRLVGGLTADFALGDLDNDGDLDAFAASFGQPCRVWLNDGRGHFRDSGQLLGGNAPSFSVALADFDGDGDLDAFVAAMPSDDTSIWLNDGRANFLRTEQRFPKSILNEVACADLDNDSDMDVVLSHWLGAVEVLLNDGTGHFEPAVKLSHPACTGVALADLDGDRHVDIVAPRLGGMSAVWWNDGHAQFTAAEMTEAVLDGISVAAADLDGDEDLDLYFTTLTGDTLVLNAGGRRFEPPRNYVGEATSETVRLADLDGDGDIDAVTVPGFRFGTKRRIWVNDGHGHFSPGPDLSDIRSPGLAIGDVNGDHLPDLLFANREKTGDDLWLNRLRRSQSAGEPPTEEASTTPEGIATLWTSDEWFWTEPENLGPKINTSGNEHSPFISADGLTLLYHGRGGKPENSVDIWQCRRQSTEGAWGDPESLGPLINSIHWEGDPCLSADGLELFFAAEWRGAFGNFDIFLATRATVDAPWSEPVNLGRNINTKLHDRSPALSADGLTLWFTRETEGSTGFDLMTATRASRGEPFGHAKLVGPPVNSEKVEADCAITADDLVLLWNVPSSPTAYAQEIWWSYRPTRTGAWQAPRKMPPRICAPGAAEASVSTDGSELYFSSARERGNLGADVEHYGGADLYVSRRVRREGASASRPADAPADQPRNAD